MWKVIKNWSHDIRRNDIASPFLVFGSKIIFFNEIPIFFFWICRFSLQLVKYDHFDSSISNATKRAWDKKCWKAKKKKGIRKWYHLSTFYLVNLKCIYFFLVYVYGWVVEDFAFSFYPSSSFYFFFLVLL